MQVLRRVVELVASVMVAGTAGFVQRNAVAQP